MSSRGLVLPLVLIAGFGGLVAWLKLAPPPEAPVAPATVREPVVPSPARESWSGSERPDGALAKVPLPDTLRNVAPEGIATPQITAPLVRVEARLPVLEQPKPDPEAEKGPLIVLRRPQVVSAGILSGNGLTLRLAHVSPLAPEATCSTEDGSSWPCGARARTALRAVVRIYALTCHRLEDLGPREVLASCKRGDLDLGRWLVRHGWALPADEAPEDFAELAEEARLAAAGQWRRSWTPLDGADTGEAGATYVPLRGPEAEASSASASPSGSLSDLELLPGLLAPVREP